VRVTVVPDMFRLDRKFEPDRSDAPDIGLAII
jgi:hypothetical protein